MIWRVDIRERVSVSREWILMEKRIMSINPYLVEIWYFKLQNSDFWRITFDSDIISGARKSNYVILGVFDFGARAAFYFMSAYYADYK